MSTRCATTCTRSSTSRRWRRLTSSGSRWVPIGPSTGCPPDRGGYGVITDEPPHWPQLLRTLHVEHHGPDHWRTLFWAIAGTWGDRPEVGRERLQELRCPILVVQGEGEVP